MGEIAGFAAGPLERGATYVRRSYTRGGESVAVTLARLPMSDAQYQDWLRGSADFPQADLGLPAAQGNGFFECAANNSDRCNLLIQLRCGLHIEIRSAPAAERAAAQAVAAGLGLRQAADSCASP